VTNISLVKAAKERAKHFNICLFKFDNYFCSVQLGNKRNSMFLPPDKSLLYKYNRASNILIGILLLIPILVLIGWNWDIHNLRKMGSPSIGMNPLTAILLMLCALSLWFLKEKK